MQSGHRTTSIPRPQRPVDPHPARPRVAASRRAQPDDAPVGGDSTLLGDLTRPIRPDRQLVRRRSNRWALALLATAVLGALGAAMFVLPVQAWLQQRDEISEKQQQLDVLERANEQLRDEVAHLQTTEGAKEAARDELGVVGPGEKRTTLLAADMASLPLPSGFPYDAIAQTVAVRAAPPPAP